MVTEVVEIIPGEGIEWEEKRDKTQGTFKERAEEENNCKGIRARSESQSRVIGREFKRSAELGNILDSAKNSAVTL